jgi:CoA-dependent NAD(P)H sulfur oxidoreductase
LQRLKPLLSPNQAVFILGTGLIGLEMAEACHTLGLETCLVDQEELPLTGFPVSMRKLLLKRLQERGVAFFGGRSLKGVREVAGGFQPEFEDGESCGPKSFQLFLDCTGSLPSTDFALRAGLKTDKRGAIVVDSTMRSSHPAVWAAGDCCIRRHLVPPLENEQELNWNPQALDANRGGRVAGFNAAAAEGTKGIELPLSPATQILSCFGLELARTGRLAASSLEDSKSNNYVSETAPSPAFQGLLGLNQTTTAPVQKEETRAITIQSRTHGHALPEASLLTVCLEAEAGGLLRGAAIIADGPGALRINQVAALLQSRGCVDDLLACDFAYSPPFGPTFDPLLIAASELKKQLGSSPLTP